MRSRGCRRVADRGIAGRPAELPGADAITGIFINTLPVRAQVPDGARVVDWLLECQAAQAESRRFDYVALGDIARWSEVPAGSNLTC